MDQLTTPRATDRESAIDRLTQHAVAAVESAHAGAGPFYHLQLSNIFPPDVYSAMLTAMPVAEDYRPMHGRSRNSKQTRVKIDLFPEYIRHLPPEKLAVWQQVGAALRSEPLKNAFRKMLAPGLEKRFGKDFASVGMFPIPILTRDIPGYLITPHTDTHWKGITVQLYLPKDESAPDIGTIFHERLPDGSMPKTKQMRFAPNSGYAFAVGDDTWHSADPVHSGVKTRDSILLTYFVDQGPLRMLRNRAKRLGNFIQNEVRNLI